MSLATKFRTVFRGDVSFPVLVREALRRRKMSARRAAERRNITEIGATPAGLRPEFAEKSSADLLAHFRTRPNAFFIDSDIADVSRKQFPAETANLISDADRIATDSKWALAGFGMLVFTGDNCWRRDPIGPKDWGLDYHADVVLFSNDGADIRVLWELNRFGHAVTLACAYHLTKDERYAETLFAHIESWVKQNPYGRGANWQCAMEVALRAINLLAAFELVRSSAALTEERLVAMLQVFDQHGRFTLENNEFSYLATSNHYLSDVVGLFWIGTFLPELEYAADWREFGLAEILREIDKQILPDGADLESSTGYHNFVTQMLLYTFLLAKKNDVEIGERYWQKLRSMLDYIHGIVRPDGRTPLIGDADGSQVVPVVKHDSDDVAYLLALAFVAFDDPKFKGFAELSPEVLWLIGEDGIERFDQAPQPTASGSAAFPNAGAHVMRDGDLYLHFNANDTGTNGRGSHAHNDALSIEVSAFGSAFIIDPGSYVYNLDREARHRFRSTAYHSTVMIDGEEQNTTIADMPFVLGNLAKPKVLKWQTAADRDAVIAEHYGYVRLSNPVTHMRTVEFDKRDRVWIVTDELKGQGTHEIAFSLHSAPGVSVSDIHKAVRFSDSEGNSLLVRTSIAKEYEIVPAGVSRNYGHIEDSSIIRWQVTTAVPMRVRTILLPAARHENLESKLELLARLAENNHS